MQINLDDHITPHFTWREMLTSSTAIRLGLDNIPPDDDESESVYANIRSVVDVLEMVRAHFSKSIHVNSCFRAPEVNKAVGGSPTSAHRFGAAADFTVQGVANIEVCKAIPTFFKNYDQIIYEFGPSGWIHLGLSQKPRCQHLSAIKENGKTVYKPGFIKP